MSNTLKFGNGEWYGKEGTILAYNSENNNYKPLPFTFDRDSVATRVNKQGLIETVGADQPRIDYSSGEGSLLLEPQSTNLLTYSEALDNYSNSNTVCTPNFAISPDGTQNATKIDFTASFTNRLGVNGSVNSGEKVTQSIFVKYVDAQYVQLWFGSAGFSDLKQTNFDLVNGTASNSAGTIKSLQNGWYRITCKNTATSTAANTGIFNLVVVNSFSASRFGDEANGSVLAFGGQYEKLSYATSYIPTQGGSAVTRLADSCNNGGNEQVINSTEGVLYFEGSSIANDGTFKRISIGTSDNLFENNLQLRYNTVDNSISYQFRVGNVYQADITITANTTNLNKIACVWKINRFEIWVNGIKEAQDTSGSVPSSNTFNSLFVGKTSTSLAEPFYGDIKDLRVYNTALTDQELAALTQV